MEQITLYYREGTSDKCYRARIEPKENGYVVLFAYGRRGSTLNTGTKTESPVPYEQAKAIYEKLVKEKQSKGYTVGTDGTPYQHTDKANQSTGIHCQLLNPVEEDQIEQLIQSPEYWMQEKFDGRRLLIRKVGSTITGINRLGLAVAVPESLVSELAHCPIDLILDGEAIGDTFCAFDLLQVKDEPTRRLGYHQRYLRLMNVMASFRHPHIHIPETHFLESDKREAFHRFKRDGCEGVVFKRQTAPYTAGRPSSGGPQLKFKFCETASFVVGKINAKRSVSLLLFDGDRIVGAGNVTIPANHEIPKPGDMVECRYLYAFRGSGCIYQPVYLGKRQDITAEECVVTQLKYKAEALQVAA